MQDNVIEFIQTIDEAVTSVASGECSVRSVRMGLVTYKDEDSMAKNGVPDAMQEIVIFVADFNGTNLITEALEMGSHGGHNDHKDTGRLTKPAGLQLVWWGWRWALKWPWLHFKRLREEETQLARIYRWTIAIGPLEIRRWA